MELLWDFFSQCPIQKSSPKNLICIGKSLISSPYFTTVKHTALQKSDQRYKKEKPLARELVEKLNASNVTVGTLVGASAYDYGNLVVQIEAYWVTCDLASLRNLEREQLEWFAPTALDQIALAPADQFLQPLLMVTKL